MAFYYNRGTRQKRVDKDPRVDSGITTTSFPTDFKDKFVARFENNINPNKQPFGVFSNAEATRFANEKLPTVDNAPNF